MGVFLCNLHFTGNQFDCDDYFFKEKIVLIMKEIYETNYKF